MNKKTLIKLVLIFFVIINVFITYSYARIYDMEASKYDITIENVPKDINKIELIVINKSSGEVDSKNEYLTIKNISTDKIKKDTLTFRIKSDDYKDPNEEPYYTNYDYYYGIKFTSPNNEKILTIARNMITINSVTDNVCDGFNIKRVYDFSTGEMTFEDVNLHFTTKAIVFFSLLFALLIFAIRNIFKLLIGGKKEKK